MKNAALVYDTSLSFITRFLFFFSSLFSPQIKQHEFREDFRKTAPFQFDSTQYYERLDKVRY